jgi:hypothetical protein
MQIKGWISKAMLSCYYKENFQVYIITWNPKIRRSQIAIPIKRSNEKITQGPATLNQYNYTGEKQEWKTIACLTSATYSGRWNCENDKGKGTGSIKTVIGTLQLAGLLLLVLLSMSLYIMWSLQCWYFRIDTTIVIRAVWFAFFFIIIQIERLDDHRRNQCSNHSRIITVTFS